MEAGRPDTITPEKLRVLKSAGVGRVSINPQSMNDAVLAAIGRKHGSADVLRAFDEARQAGFDEINMDLIAGLTGDTAETFAQTVDTLLHLSPENITVHTLAIKRGADLTDKAAAAAQRCTAGCTVQCQQAAPSSSAALIYQRARPPALAPAAKLQTSTAAAAKAAISRKKQRSAPSPSARRTASRTPASRQPSPRHHSTSPSTAHGAGDGAI